MDNIKKTENAIKDKLPKPPKSHYIFSLKEDVQKWYKKKLEHDNVAYTNSSDIWFIYFDTNGIQRWVSILKPIIDTVIIDYEESDY